MSLDKVTIIGFCGAKQSGKNTSATMVKDIVMEDGESRDFTETHIVGIESFAAPIKSMIAMLLDFYGVAPVTQGHLLVPYLEGDLKEVVIPALGVSPRSLMQTLGTDWGRNIVNPDIWLNSMRIRLTAYEEMRKHGYKSAIVMVTDVRFDNECELIHSLGGKIVRIDRPGHGGVDEHDSEAGVTLTNIDQIIDNDGTLEDLKEKIGTFCWDELQIATPAEVICVDEPVLEYADTLPELEIAQ